MMSSASKPSHDQHRDVERLNHAAHMRQRGAQVLRHLLALRLVFREIHVPLRRRLRVERHRDMRRLPRF